MTEIINNKSENSSNHLMNGVTQPKKMPRNLAFRWVCQQARQEFKNYALSVKLSLGELKKDHSVSSILGNVFDITFKITVMSVRTLLLATAKFIHGLALTIFNPSAVPVIKKNPSNREDESVRGSGEDQSNKAIQDEENLDASTSSLKVEGSSSHRSDSNNESVSESDEEPSNIANQGEENLGASPGSADREWRDSRLYVRSDDSVNEADGETLGASTDSIDMEWSDFQSYRPEGEFRNLERQEAEKSPL